MQKEDEFVRAWVTKYALTTGIEVVDGRVAHKISSDMFCYGNHETAHGKDWHRTPEAALSRAEEMRANKIKSLHASIKKMEKLEFKVPV
jgi:hypothetical protein